MEIDVFIDSGSSDVFNEDDYYTARISAVIFIDGYGYSTDVVAHDMPEKGFWIKPLAFTCEGDTYEFSESEALMIENYIAKHHADCIEILYSDIEDAKNA